MVAERGCIQGSPATSDMAGAEALTTPLVQSAVIMQQFQQAQQAHGSHMFEAFTAASRLVSQDFGQAEVSRGPQFWRSQGEWKEFALKLRTTVEEINPKLHVVIMWTETEAEEIARREWEGEEEERRERRERDQAVVRRGRRVRENDVVEQTDAPLEGSAADDPPDRRGQERLGAVANAHAQV